MCYSDHNEDIRTKRRCEYCGSVIPIIHLADLFDRLSAEKLPDREN